LHNEETYKRISTQRSRRGSQAEYTCLGNAAKEISVIRDACCEDGNLEKGIKENNKGSTSKKTEKEETPKEQITAEGLTVLRKYPN